jgi:hypothetical protein
MTAFVHCLQRALAHPRQLPTSIRAIHSFKSVRPPESYLPSRSQAKFPLSIPYCLARPKLAASSVANNVIAQRSHSASFHARFLCRSAILTEANPLRDLEVKQERSNEALPKEFAVLVEGFERSEKASKAAQINLSARLTKDGKGAGGKPGWVEIIRLLKIARPESKLLGGKHAWSRLGTQTDFL